MRNAFGGVIKERAPMSLNFALWVGRQDWFQRSSRYDALLQQWLAWWEELRLLRKMDPTERHAGEARWVDPAFALEPFPRSDMPGAWTQQWRSFVDQFQEDAAYQESLRLPAQLRQDIRRHRWEVPSGEWVVDLVWDPLGLASDFGFENYALLALPRNEASDVFRRALFEAWRWRLDELPPA